MILTNGYLQEILNTAKNYCSKDVTREALRGCYINYNSNNLTLSILATNGHILYNQELTEQKYDLDSFNILVDPKKYLKAEKIKKSDSNFNSVIDFEPLKKYIIDAPFPTNATAILKSNIKDAMYINSFSDPDPLYKIGLLCESFKPLTTKFNLIKIRHEANFMYIEVNNKYLDINLSNIIKNGIKTTGDLINKHIGFDVNFLKQCVNDINKMMFTGDYNCKRLDGINGYNVKWFISGLFSGSIFSTDIGTDNHLDILIMPMRIMN